MTMALAALIVPNLVHFEPGNTAEVDLTFWTPRHLSENGYESTTVGEVTPRWMTSVPPYTINPALVVAGQGQVRDFERTPFAYSGEVTAATAARIRLSTAWYPGWTVRVDGRTVDAGPSVDTGLIEFTTPVGTHTIDLRFGRSPARLWGEAISVTALAGLAVVAWARRRRRDAGTVQARAAAA